VRSVELFAGAGGLAIAMARAGFHHAAVIEWNSEACETFRENQRHHTHHIEECHCTRLMSANSTLEP
jgi:DNA (cytosine-5)-methyltransferase 1